MTPVEVNFFEKKEHIYAYVSSYFVNTNENSQKFKVTKQKNLKCLDN